MIQTELKVSDFVSDFTLLVPDFKHYMTKTLFQVKMNVSDKWIITIPGISEYRRCDIAYMWYSA
jgi:hypothetical protein